MRRKNRKTGEKATIIAIIEELYPLLKRFWEKIFPPALQKALEKISENCWIDFVSLKEKDGKIRIWGWKRVGLGGDDVWVVMCGSWVALLLVSTDHTPSTLTITHYVDIIVNFSHGDEGEVEAVVMIPREIKAEEIEIKEERSSHKLSPNIPNIAKYNEVLGNFEVEDQTLLEIADAILKALHLDKAKINLWLWEIGRIIIENLSKRLRGISIEYPPSERGKLTIEGIVYFPLTPTRSNFFVENNRKEEGGLRGDTIQLQNQIQVHTREGTKINGGILVEVTFLTPETSTTPPPPPRVWLRSVFLVWWKPKKQYEILLSALQSFDKEVICENYRLPPPETLLGDDVIDEILNKVRSELETIG